jgi:hypothetical protein
MEDNDSMFEVESEDISKRSIAEEFEEERKKWKDKVLEMANRVNKLDQVASLQVDLYSSRQIIIERISKLYQYLALYNSVYKTKKKELFLKYTIDSDIKLGQGEKTIMVEGDLADLQKKVNLIEHHIDYYKETVKNLDSMLYGVRNKLQIEQFLSGK